MDAEVNNPTNNNSIKVPKVVKLTDKKRLSVINSPMSPPSLKEKSKVDWLNEMKLRLVTRLVYNYSLFLKCEDSLSL